MSEMCCTRLAQNTGRKNDAKNRHLRTIAELCPAISSQRRHVSTVGKIVKQLGCGPVRNLMVALPNIGGALCSMPQSLADAHY